MDQWIFKGISNKNNIKYYFNDTEGKKWSFSKKTIQKTILWDKVPRELQNIKSKSSEVIISGKKKNYNILFNNKNFIFPKKECDLEIKIIGD